MNIFDILLHFIFPINCPICGKLGVKICPECRDYLPNEKALYIPKQNIPSLFNQDIITREINGLTVYSTLYYHNEAVKRIIQRFKYENEKDLCRPLGSHMAQKFIKCRADYLVPVPLHLFSERKYNQSRELAEGMSDFWGVEIIDCALWTRDVPRRATSKIRTDITYEDFRLTRDLYGKKIALIDDVCTSGMTISCLAEACKRDGAKVICAYTLASV